MNKLSRDFYRRDDTLLVARELIGKLLVVPAENGARVAGMIVETEAYLGAEDKAAHSYNHRRTPRNEITYAAGGRVYVFFIYGMYFQFNVVTGAVDSPHVVLVRALEPVAGIDTMRARRLVKNPSAKMPDKNLASGPGKLCIALAIDRSLNGADLGGERIWIEDYRAVSADEIKTGKRIGIDYAEEFAGKPWRFWLADNPCVSRK
ncbi:MAG: DNA-3-methyladenine glycosylase [Acidobacteria bacterium]|nr:DNA-3-methyladenine glycosylase [Acidobacteriota bacterium]